MSDLLSLTESQTEIYYDQSRNHGIPIYNVGVILEVNVAIEHGSLQRAIDLLVSRISILSMKLKIGNNEQCMQTIDEDSSINVAFIDLVDVSNGEETARKSIEQTYCKVFDLLNDQLITVDHYRVSYEKHWIVLKSHHIVADGYAIADLSRLIGLAYSEIVHGVKPEAFNKITDFTDEVQRENAYLSSAKFDKDWQYWSEKLVNPPPLLFNNNYRASSIEAHHYRSDLSDTTVSQLRQLAKDARISLQQIGLAALSIYFAIVNDSDDMLIAVPTYRRRSFHQKHMLGTMAKDLPCRLRPSGDLTLKEYLIKVAGELRKNYRHTDFPFARLFRETNILSQERQTLLDVVYNYELRGNGYLLEGEEIVGHYLFSGVEASALHLRLIDFNDVQPLAIYLSVQKGVMDKKEVILFAERLKHIFEQLGVDSYHKKLCEFSVLPKKEQKMLLSDFSGSSKHYEYTKPVNLCFEEQVRTFPNAIAVASGKRLMTYCELNNAANFFANELIKNGVLKGNRVMVYSNRDTGFVAAMLGIWKTGAVYVPLDPKHPIERINYIIEDADPAIIICDDSITPLPENSRYTYIYTNMSIDAYSDNSDYECLNVNQHSDAAYLIYTSGSTGKPKGAVIHHGGVMHHIYAMYDALGLLNKGNLLPVTMLQSASSSSDISIWQLIAPIVSGGKTVICDYVFDIPRLLKTIQGEKIELVEFVPSVIRLIVEYLNEIDQSIQTISSLKWLLSTGDVIPLSLVNDWLNIAPEVPVINAYGPTETSDDVSVNLIRHRINKTDKLVSIGKPLANTSIHIVDQCNRLMPVGVIGELCVSGVCVGMGYWNDNKKTAQRFVSNPFVTCSSVHGNMMYRSGDLGKWNADGNLMYIGRIDHQVQVRGYRVELEEIESCLATYEEVAEVAVINKESDSQIDGCLVAYVRCAVSQQLDIDELKKYALNKLPDYMVPAYFIIVSEMPRNSADKIDRKSLEKLELHHEVSSEIKPPHVKKLSTTEAKLADIWGDLLDVPAENFVCHSDFFKHGGHSLTAVRLVSAVRGNWQIEIEIRHIFEFSELAALAQFIENSYEQETSVISPAPANIDIPLSYAQQRIWFLNQLSPNGTEYNASVLIRITGEVNLFALEQAFIHLVERHLVLRTTYLSKDNQEIQVVGNIPNKLIQIILLPNEIDILNNKAVNSLVQTYTDKAFDLNKDLMVRCVLFKTTGQSSLLSLTVHHIASDGWSQGVMMKELAILYGQYSNYEKSSDLSKLSVQYKDYAYWQRQQLTGDTLNKLCNYWRQYLEGLPQVHNLPLDYMRPTNESHNGGLLVSYIKKSFLDDMYSLMGEHKLTLFMMLKAVFTCLLYRYSGKEDIVIGSPVANREQIEIETLVGFFVNTLVFRTQFSKSTTFIELLEQCKANALDSYAHQQMPFEVLVDVLQPKRSTSYNPLFQIMLTLENNNIDDWILSGLDTEIIEPDSIASQFDLSLDVLENEDGLKLTWNYASDLFSKDTIKQLSMHFEVLMKTLCADPKQTLSCVEILSEAEQKKLLLDFNDSQNHALLTTPWPVLFENTAFTYPDKIAAVYGDKAITYRELDNLTLDIAQRLNQSGINRNNVVAILSDRDLNILISIISVLRAGAAYIALDPDHPKNRLQSILEQASPDLLLVADNKDKMSLELKSIQTNLKITSVRKLKGEKFTTKIQKPKISLDDLAYLISTSGSTGVPKCAMLNQRGMINNMLSKIKPLDLGPNDVIAQTASQSFDISVWQFLTALILGATTDIVPKSVIHNPDHLVNYMHDHKINIWEQVPSVMKVVLSNTKKLPHMRYVVTTGEVISLNLVKQWFNKYPDIPLFNAYGPAECSDDVTLERIDAPVKKIYIGKPVSNACVHILDDQLKLVPIGVVGEIAISGSVVGLGYRNDLELTKKVFVKNPYAKDISDERLYLTGDLGRRSRDGKIEFLGRKDHQVKIRGFRIELEEISSTLNDLEQIEDSIVIDHEIFENHHQLIAFYILVKSKFENLEPLLSSENFRTHLHKFLPDYMIPSRFIALESLPLNPNGKINRKGLLKYIDENVDAIKREFSETEKIIADIWQELLELEKLTLQVDSDFFAVGGHSLLVIRLLTLINMKFNVTMSVRSIFDFRSIEAMALQVDFLVSQKENANVIDKLNENQLEEVEF